MCRSSGHGCGVKPSGGIGVFDALPRPMPELTLLGLGPRSRSQSDKGPAPVRPPSRVFPQVWRN